MILSGLHASSIGVEGFDLMRKTCFYQTYAQNLLLPKNQKRGKQRGVENQDPQRQDVPKRHRPQVRGVQAAISITYGGVRTSSADQEQRNALALGSAW
jgi:hypothetical protein